MQTLLLDLNLVVRANWPQPVAGGIRGGWIWSGWRTETKGRRRKKKDRRGEEGGGGREGGRRKKKKEEEEEEEETRKEILFLS